MTEFSLSTTLASRLWQRVVMSRTVVLKFSTDFFRIVRDWLDTSKPRKVNPSRNVVTRVFVGLSNYTAMLGDPLFSGSLKVTVLYMAMFVPSLFIVFTILCINLMGDGLRDAFDPRHRI